MFSKSVVFSSLLALALGKPVARRDGHLSSGTVNSGFNVVPNVIHSGQAFDLNSPSVLGFNQGGQFSFNNFGGLSSLNGFDDFFGQGNFIGGQNQHVLIQQQVCQVTPVHIVQQHLAIISEYAKQIILTQSCETEAQVLLFSQWLGGLVNWGQDLRRINGIQPSFDSHIASQIVNVVNIDPISGAQVINNNGFNFFGSSIGQHGVSVTGVNWVNEISPGTVGFVWDSAVLSAGPHIQLNGGFNQGFNNGFPSVPSSVVVSQKKA